MKEEKVLILLKKLEELPTSRIAHELSVAYYPMRDLLEKMKGDKKIKSRVKGKFVYWRLK